MTIRLSTGFKSSVLSLTPKTNMDALFFTLLAPKDGNILVCVVGKQRVILLMAFNSENPYKVEWQTLWSELFVDGRRYEQLNHRRN